MMGTPARAALGLAALSLAVNLSMLTVLGIRHGQDTIQFLDGASHLLSGEPLRGKEPSYVGYIAIIAAARAVGSGDGSMVALQFLVAAAAIAALYDLGRRLAGGTAGIITAAFVAIDVDIARWHVFVLTDSLYLSTVILVVWAACRTADYASSFRYGLAAALVAVAALLRPNGWLLGPIVAVFCISQTQWSQRTKTVGVAVAIVLSVWTIVSLPPGRTAVESERPDRALRDGVVMFGAPAMNIAMPKGVSRQPIAIAKLAIARVGLELIHVRPFYSRAHNAAIVVLLVLVYPLAVIGAVRWRREPLAQLAIAVVAADLLIVAATFADWDGRFLLHTFALITVLAAGEAAVRLRGRRLTPSRAA